MRTIINDDGGGTGGTTYSDDSDVTKLPLPDVGPARLLAALILVVMDELNTIRGDADIGLAALTAQDMVDKIEAKL